MVGGGPFAAGVLGFCDLAFRGELRGFGCREFYGAEVGGGMDFIDEFGMRGGEKADELMGLEGAAGGGRHISA